MLGMAAACNSDSDSDKQEVAVTSSTVAINSFYLKADAKVMKNLDSVFFSIDLNKAIIFNADSLPKGTDISRLLPSVNFASSMSAVNLAVLAENGDTIKSVDYLRNPNDSIDFSKTVRLKVTSLDKKNSLEYDIKVNVHLQDPDSIGWNKIEEVPMASRLDNPVAQKTVVKDTTPYSLIKESDGSYSLAVASDIFNDQWEIEATTLNFTPRIESFTASGSEFFILSEDDELFSSADAKAWTSKANGWTSIIGVYNGDTLLGIKDISGVPSHVSLTDGNEIEGGAIAGDFPVSGRSQLGETSNKWSLDPTALFAGGVCMDGTLSSATWAFDGTSWAPLSRELPQIEGASMIKYVMYRKSPTTSVIKDFDAWILLGGRLADGTPNKVLYVSFDNGVSWKATGTAMNLPSQFPDVAGQDAFVIAKAMQSDLVPAIGSRADYIIDGTQIIWDCPYIFIVGGYLPDATLSPEIWKGVLMRLNFVPII